jgi:2-dehydro-3-deoxyphosphooctonate aldolase (KDO 8-P synthase)
MPPAGMSQSAASLLNARQLFSCYKTIALFTASDRLFISRFPPIRQKCIFAAGKAFKPMLSMKMQKKIVKVGDIACGADELFLISGPCVIEDESTMMRTAEKLREVSERLKLPIIYKSSFQKDNRSSVQYYMGPGLEKGLEVLARIKKEFGFPILSDIHYPDQVKTAAEVLDVIQIPAYLCMQTTLLVEAARSGKVVNIKHGQFLAPENMAKPAQKCVDSGNDQIILTERGYTFGYNDLIVDPRSFYHLRQTGYPVVFDITHSIRKYGIPSADPNGGAREFLPVISRAGVASGVDGVFIETHPEPAKALCDAASQLCVYDLEEFIKPLLDIHQVNIKYRNNQ